MPNTDRADLPAGRYGGKWLKNEVAGREARVRDSERTRTKLASAPKDDVEIEHARTPAAAAAAAELALEGLEAREYLGRLQAAFDQGNGVGEVAAGAAMGCVEHDRRGIEQTELLVEAGNCGFDDALRSAKTAVRPVGADRHDVEVRCA